MPFVSITLAEGRTPEVLRALIHEVTLAVERSGAAPRENVRVVLHEVPPTHFAAGDVTLAERAAVSAPLQRTRGQLAPAGVRPLGPKLDGLTVASRSRVQSGTVAASRSMPSARFQ